jgi:hypothetical protein
MSHTIRISQAIMNGINSLQEEVAQGFGSATFLAGRNLRTALRKDNDHAALYWREVARACRRLEQQTARTKTRITA